MSNPKESGKKPQETTTHYRTLGIYHLMATPLDDVAAQLPLSVQCGTLNADRTQNPTHTARVGREGWETTGLRIRWGEQLAHSFGGHPPNVLGSGFDDERRPLLNLFALLGSEESERAVTVHRLVQAGTVTLGEGSAAPATSAVSGSLKHPHPIGVGKPYSEGCHGGSLGWGRG